MPSDRIKQQLGFLLEIDKLKEIRRQSLVTGSERRENSAEHSWHLAMFIMVLADHATRPDIDWLRVFQMALIHDIVEIDAGDTYCYDEDAHRDKAEREQAAADRLFSLLPDDQAEQFHALWREFEARETPESVFANAADRFQPMMLNYNTAGRSWRAHGIRRDQVLERNGIIAEGIPDLWQEALALIDDAVQRGDLLP